VAGDPLAIAYERALATARAAWPALAVPDAAFVHHLAARLPAGQDPAAAIARAHVADLYLAVGCLRGVPGALAAFDRELAGVIASFLGRDASDELAQVVRERVLVAAPGETARLAGYTGRGPLGAWLRVVAVRVALNLRRASDASRRAEAAAGDELGRDLDPELDFIKARYRPMFRAALEASIRALPAKRRNMLRMYFLDGMTLAQIAVLFGVHESTIARQLAATRHEIVERTRRELVDGHGLAADEAQSLIELCASRAELALSSVLRASR